MSYQSDIYTALTSNAPGLLPSNANLRNLVGTSIFPDVADGTVAPPFIVYQTISTSGDTLHDGTRSIEFPLIQFSCWASSRANAIELASTLNTVLDGNAIEGTSAVVFMFSNQQSEYESDTKLFGEILEYRVATNTN